MRAQRNSSDNWTVRLSQTYSKKKDQYKNFIVFSEIQSWPPCEWVEGRIDQNAISLKFWYGSLSDVCDMNGKMHIYSDHVKKVLYGSLSDVSAMNGTA